MTDPIVQMFTRLEILAWSIAILGWILTIGMTAAVASLKHRDPVDWALGALFLGPIILLIASFIYVREETTPPKWMFKDKERMLGELLGEPKRGGPTP